MHNIPVLNKATADLFQMTCNVIATVIECDRLMGILPRVRWSEYVVTMATKLMEACIEHLRNHFIDVIATQKFLALGKVHFAWI